MRGDKVDLSTPEGFVAVDERQVGPPFYHMVKFLHFVFRQLTLACLQLKNLLWTHTTFGFKSDWFVAICHVFRCIFLDRSL